MFGIRYQITYTSKKVG